MAVYKRKQRLKMWPVLACYAGIVQAGAHKLDHACWNPNYAGDLPLTLTLVARSNSETPTISPDRTRASFPSSFRITDHFDHRD